MRVLLIDDHTLFRAGLAELLERHGIEVVGAVGDGDSGIALAQQLDTDVVLLDLRMPNKDGLEVLRELGAVGIGVPVVALTTSSDENDLVEALRGGAKGYLLKDMEPDALVAALRRIIEGEAVVDDHLTAVMTAALRNGGGDGDGGAAEGFGALTPREREILRFLAEGQSNKMIGRSLGISDGTVKLHVKAILRKLGIRSRVEAAVLAVEQGFLRTG